MSSDILESSTGSRCPKQSPFYQQTLPAWHPMLTARRAGIMFLIFALFFIPVGITLILVSNQVTEYVWDYSDCVDPNSDRVCSEVINSATPCVCKKTIIVSSPLPKPVFLYYGLMNFYQNHRRFGRSKSDKQLLGTPQAAADLTSCQPFASILNGTNQLAILPCGAIANSIFNDTFKVKLATSNKEVPMTNQGIAWKSDIERKYGLLSPEALANTVKPPNWPAPITSRGTNPFKSDEELMVWMKPAALSTFRKLHRRVTHEGIFAEGFPVGSYEIEVTYNYPVKSFDGRKFVVLGNTSWLGGKNLSLGITCLVAGSIHFLLSIAFFILHPYSDKIYPFLLRLNRNRGKENYNVMGPCPSECTEL